MRVPNRNQKWLTVIVMGIVTLGTVYVTLTQGLELEHLGRSYGPAGHAARMYLWGAEIALCIAVWLATYGLCAVVQRSFDVWQGFNLLPVLLVAVILLNFGPFFARQLGVAWPVYADQNTIQAIREDNRSQIAMNDNACQAALDAVGFPKFMRPFSLGAEKGLAKTRAKIKETRAVEHACLQRDQTQAAKFRQAIEALSGSEQIKREALAQDSTDADRIRLRQIDSELLNEYDQTINDLASAQGNWYVHNFSMAFYRHHDADLFQAHMAKAKKLTDERALVTKRLWARNVAAEDARDP